MVVPSVDTEILSLGYGIGFRYDDMVVTATRVMEVIFDVVEVVIPTPIDQFIK